jgi:2',3'-cyclic-nucleotide 2'-phosphodiesterase
VRILFIGDIVGKPGREIVVRATPGLRIEQQLDMVVANAENVAGGSGLTPVIYHELIGCGVDCITMGDHIYRRREIYQLLDQESRIVKPANYPESAPGRSYAVIRTRSGIRVAVFNLLGRVFMPPVDCPFRAADRVLNELPQDVRVILLDLHAEATSDKQAMSRYLDGRVSAVLGTHTHVPTADERILPGGTAFQCDVGMAGPHESILGRRIDRVLETVRTFRPTHFEVATGDCRLNGAIIDIVPETGRATAICRLVVDEEESIRLGGVAQKNRADEDAARKRR